MSLPGRDSSFSAPTLAQAKVAYAAGVRVWGGYFGSRDRLGLAVRWNRLSFWNLQQAGIIPIGFCSGNDDPDWIRTTAAAWGILPCVDVETGIRVDGSWVRPWVQRARCGLYGLASVHYRAGEPLGRSALFNIVARYPKGGCGGGLAWDPAAGPEPPVPCAWQCQGSHAEFDLEVDSANYDNSFATLLGGALPAATTTGGIGMGATTQGFNINGTTHVFELSSEGDLLWWRGTGGGGGQVHAGRDGWWNMGGTGVPGGIRDFAAWLDGDQIVIRAKFVNPAPAFAASVAEDHPDDLLRSAAATSRKVHAALEEGLVATSPEPLGLALGLVLRPDGQTQASSVALSWFQYDNAGPFRLPSLPGPMGPKGDPASADDVVNVIVGRLSKHE